VPTSSEGLLPPAGFVYSSRLLALNYFPKFRSTPPSFSAFSSVLCVFLGVPSLNFSLTNYFFSFFPSKGLELCPPSTRMEDENPSKTYSVIYSPAPPCGMETPSAILPAGPLILVCPDIGASWRNLYLPPPRLSFLHKTFFFFPLQSCAHASILRIPGLPALGAFSRTDLRLICDPCEVNVSFFFAVLFFSVSTVT